MKRNLQNKVSLIAVGFLTLLGSNVTFAQGEDCATATAITPGTYTGTTVGALVDAAPFCGTADGTGGGVWYQVTGTNNCGIFTASLCTGTAYDTKIRVYDGTCGALNCIGGSDDVCGVQSEYAWNYTPGTTYYILVHGSAAAEGAFSLLLSESSTDVIDPVPASTLTAGGVDQANLIDNAYMAAFSQTDLAQSFIPAQNSICGASVYTYAGAGSNGDLTISLYSNLPNAGGVLLASGVSVNAGSGMWADVYWTPVSVTPGVTYYLVFTCTNGGMGLDGDVNNNYPGGNVYANGGYGPFPGFDYTFQTFYGCGVLSPITSICPLSSLPIPTADDNCAGTIDGVSDAVFPISSNTLVTWTYDDGNGNVTTETQQVNVTADATDPVPDLGSLPDLNENCSSTPVAPTATDNCAGVITGVPDVTFPILASGLTVVTWTFDDGNGNSVTQTQNVNLLTVDASAAQTGATITANSATATYVWLDCNNAYAVIAGETGQSYTPTAITGSYAVEVTENGCVDTSACFVVDYTTISEVDNSVMIAVYPNPSTDNFNVQMNGLDHADVVINVLDVQGKIVYSKTLTNVNGTYTENVDASLFEKGVYAIEIRRDNVVLISEQVVKM